MCIRNAAKAIICNDNNILLIKCHAPHIGQYYVLPGGGQHKYETINDALIRECLEETGYTVKPQNYIALYEEIYTDDFVRQAYSDYSHKIIHIFKCTLADDSRIATYEKDNWQLNSVWVNINEVSSINLLPACIGENIINLIYATLPMFLGSHYIDYKITV